jgi:hypothetical protein
LGVAWFLSKIVGSFSEKAIACEYTEEAQRITLMPRGIPTRAKSAFLLLCITAPSSISLDTLMNVGHVSILSFPFLSIFIHHVYEKTILIIIRHGAGKHC